MLAEYSSTVNKLSFVLGSQSPRRHLIFRENLGLKFQVVLSNFPEDILKSSCSGPEDYVSKTCFSKARDIILQHYPQVDAEASYPHIIVTADTIVVQGDEILEKPTSRENCRYILNKLSDRSHEVITAVSIAALLKPSSSSSASSISAYQISTFVEKSVVDFAKLSESSIESYMDTGEPFDKAGGYGIQGFGSSFVKGIRGCFFNVMGFPVHRFCAEIIPILIQFEKEQPFF
jgi:septum formation protein